MNREPLVTVAIPIYNAEKYLKDAIQSCINQTFMNWELLLMCDGSTDGSTTIAHEMASKDVRIRVVDDAKNKGLVFRLNQSVQLARGNYYARMDADDIMYITRLEKQVHYLNNNTDVDVVGSSSMLIDANNRIIGSADMSHSTSNFMHPSIMGHTNWFRSNPYSVWATRAEDSELWLRTFKKSKFHNIAHPLIFYREFGVPTLSKTLASYITMRKIYKNYKSYDNSFFWYIINYLTSYAKTLIYIILSCCGKTDTILKLRRRNPIPDWMLLSHEDLKKSITAYK